MMKAEASPAAPYLEALEQIVTEIVVPSASDVDKNGKYPRAALEALGRTSLLGLISSPDVGGRGESHRAAALVVERLASACASTAMVVCMHTTPVRR